MNRAIRREQERRAYDRHQRSPKPLHYKSKYPGKTQGKLCSCVLCGNPRRYFGKSKRKELNATRESPELLYFESLDPGFPDERDVWDCDCDNCLWAHRYDDEPYVQPRFEYRPLSALGAYEPWRFIEELRVAEILARMALRPSKPMVS